MKVVKNFCFSKIDKKSTYDRCHRSGTQNHFAKREGCSRIAELLKQTQEKIEEKTLSNIKSHV